MLRLRLYRPLTLLVSMQAILGFIVGLFIGATGIGAGLLMLPLLLTVLDVPTRLAVGSALAYSSIIKGVLVPVQIWRRHVDFRLLAYMLIGGLPGAAAGSLLLRRFDAVGSQDTLKRSLGLIVIASALMQLCFYRRAARSSPKTGAVGPFWLAAVMLPVGAELGFSSAGAGAIGTLALLSLGSLTAVQVVGTNLAFGLCASLVGAGVHLAIGNCDLALVYRLAVGGVAGALLGNAVASFIPNRYLRVLLLVLVLISGFQLSFGRSFHLLRGGHLQQQGKL